MISREREMQIAQALNQAIWLRDKLETLNKEEILHHIKQISEYNVFSSRQLSAIVNGVIHHSTISKLTGKTDKTGGNLNVGTLDILKHLLITRATERTDFTLVATALGMGTSQGMISKLTGINQSTISKTLKERRENR